MSIADIFKDIKIKPEKSEATRPRFSLTSDILSYRRCRRQYGFFSQDGFVPSQASQAFYGQVIHQVLDRCHRYFGGLDDPAVKGKIPPDDKIDEYFDQVANALIAHGQRPYRAALKESAKQVIKTFNRLEGPELYPRVVDTECRLEVDQDKYVLRGVADVLASADAEGGDKALEIWDYKGSEQPGLASERLKDYIWQMCVYAELYKRKEGAYPAKAILYFMNELVQKKGQPPVTKRPKRAILEVLFDEAKIAEALTAFNTTALEIMARMESRCWEVPDLPPEIETCNACDKRFDCEVHQKADGSHTYYPPRLPMN